jgi:hypothetical protein
MTDPNLMLDVKSQGANATIPAPPVCIVILTYLRTEMAIRTVRGVCDYLDYPKELLSFYIADDGSPSGHVQVILDAIKESGIRLAGYHNEKFFPGTTFCGQGWNTALQKGHQNAPILLWLEDDWELRNPLDIRPYVWLLQERNDIGIVRLGCLAVGSDVKVQGFQGIHYLEYLRSTPYAYSGNPQLRHVRFSEYYGPFQIDVNPGDVELKYDAKFREMAAGPSIWRPAGINPWGVFGHIGKEKTW